MFKNHIISINQLIIKKMDKNQFLANFADQFDDTDASEITLSTEFHDLDE